MIKDLLDGGLGMVPKATFVIGGVKEYESGKYGFSQMIFPDKGDDGFIILNNQEEMLGTDAGSTVVFIASSKEFNGQTELKGIEVCESKGGKRYLKIGKGAERYMGSEVSNAPEVANAAPVAKKPYGGGAGGAPAARKHTVDASLGQSMEELIKYGTEAVLIAIDNYEGTLPDAVKAAVYNSAMYGIKEGRTLRAAAADPLVGLAKEFLDGKDEEDEVPF